LFPMDLKKLSNQPDSCIAFIYKNMQPYTFQLNEDSPAQALSFYNINRILSANSTNYSFCENPVQHIYAWFKDSTQFCLYLLTDLHAEYLDRVSKELGYPDNITREDFDNRDFDFLDWYKSRPLNVAIFRNFERRSPKGCIVIITNMKWDELGRKESLVE
jgi:hypothetical protein